MKKWMFLVALVMPATAQAGLTSFSGRFEGAVTSGSLFIFFINGSHYNPIPNIVGNVIDLNVDLNTQAPFGEDVLQGGFGARVHDVQPPSAQFFGGSAFLGYPPGPQMTLTATTFTLELFGEALPNNSTGYLKLMADRQGQALVNWHGIASGYEQPFGHTAEQPHDYCYRDVTFTLDRASFLINGSQTVPEPATWAFMICGFGLAGAGVRQARRGRTKVAWR